MVLFINMIWQASMFGKLHYQRDHNKRHLPMILHTCRSTGIATMIRPSEEQILLGWMKRHLAIYGEVCVPYKFYDVVYSLTCQCFMMIAFI